MRDFPASQTVGWLGRPIDYMSVIVVLLLMALCGRSSLYSLL
jgi:hypothetical protein